MNRHVKMACLIVCLAGMFGLNQAARATTAVFTAVNAVGTNVVRPADETINGDGLAFAVPATITGLSDLPKHNEDPNSTAGFHGGMWLATGTTDSITFDLGSVKTVDTLIVWNYAEVPFANTTPIDSSTRGAKSVNIYADNNPNPTTLITTSGPMTFNQAVPTPLGSTNVSITPFFNDDYSTSADIYTLSTPITAEYIKFDILSNWDDTGYLGLSEVRFGDTVATPEPASLSLLACASLLVLRRRK